MGKFFSSFCQEKTCLGFFALLRVFIGYSFLTAGWQKYLGGWLNPSTGSAPLTGVLSNWLSGATPMPPGWYRNFLVDIAVPNAHLFGILVCLGEVFVGALLLLGLCTRLSGLLGAFMCLNYYLAARHTVGAVGLVNETFVVANLLLLLSAAGRAWGIDWFLHRSMPKSPLW